MSTNYTYIIYQRHVFVEINLRSDFKTFEKAEKDYNKVDQNYSRDMAKLQKSYDGFTEKYAPKSSEADKLEF